MFSRLAAWIRGLFSRSIQSTTPSVMVGETLNPDTVVDSDAVANELPRLVGEFSVENPKGVFGDLASLVAASERSYQAIATAMLRVAQAGETTDTSSVTVAIDGVKSAIASAATRRAARLIANRKEADEAKPRLAWLLTALTGNPRGTIKARSRGIEAGVFAAIFGGTLALEFLLNFGVVEYDTDAWTSAAFSITFSLVTAVAAFAAAWTLKVLLGYDDTARERAKNYPTGRDPITKLAPPMLLRPAWLPYGCLLAHGLWLGSSMVLVWIRWEIIDQHNLGIGAMAPTAAVVFLLGLVYLVELALASKYPASELSEYLELRKKVEKLASERATLGDVLHDKEVKRATADYKTAVTNARMIAAATTVVGQSAREHFARLIGEARSSRTWFRDFYRDMVRGLAAQIRLKHLGGFSPVSDADSDDLDAMFEAARPKELPLDTFVPPGSSPTLSIESVDFAALASAAWHKAVTEAEEEAGRVTKPEPVEPPLRFRGEKEAGHG